MRRGALQSCLLAVRRDVSRIYDPAQQPIAGPSSCSWTPRPWAWACACEMTEVGAVLVGGGELHAAVLARAMQPAARRGGSSGSPGLRRRWLPCAPPRPRGRLAAAGPAPPSRVLVAHNAPFDRRVLRRAFERIGPDGRARPVLCTAALARKLLPLQNRRGLSVLADALGVEVQTAHRALADAETCARVLCAMFPRLCANALTVAMRWGSLAGAGSAPGTQAPRSPRSPRRPSSFRGAARARACTCSATTPVGCSTFGKSISIRSRAAPTSRPRAAVRLDGPGDRGRLPEHELGAGRARAREPPDQAVSPSRLFRLARKDERLCYIRCRLDIAFPILEVASEPAAGHAVTIGPLRGRRLAHELVEQLDSLFGLRHCGRGSAPRPSVRVRADGPLPVALPRRPRSEPVPPPARRGAAAIRRRRRRPEAAAWPCRGADASGVRAAAVRARRVAAPAAAPARA